MLLSFSESRLTRMQLKDGVPSCMLMTGMLCSWEVMAGPFSPPRIACLRTTWLPCSRFALFPHPSLRVVVGIPCSATWFLMEYVLAFGMVCSLPAMMLCRMFMPGESMLSSESAICEGDIHVGLVVRFVLYESP